jgi:hypothetical protein
MTDAPAPEPTKVDEEARKYEPRLLAYIDVLGWTNLIMQSVSRPELLNELFIGQNWLASVPFAETEGKKFFSQHGLSTDMNLDATHFSDTLVISCPIKSPASDMLLPRVQGICESLLWHGHYTRGAIVVGDLVHRENLIFGPALIEAYKLERDVAKYPRIIVTPAALPHVHPTISLPDGRTTYFRNVRMDFDGLVYVDILGSVAGMQSEKRRSRGFETKVIELVRKKIAKDEGNLGLLAKHNWMLNYLLSVVREAEQEHGSTR